VLPDVAPSLRSISLTNKEIESVNKPQINKSFSTE
jgi:hypothetical protein